MSSQKVMYATSGCGRAGRGESRQGAAGEPRQQVQGVGHAGLLPCRLVRCCVRQAGAFQGEDAAGPALLLATGLQASQAEERAGKPNWNLKLTRT